VPARAAEREPEHAGAPEREAEREHVPERQAERERVPEREADHRATPVAPTPPPDRERGGSDPRAPFLGDADDLLSDVDSEVDDNAFKW
jgi:hypothetical protein